MSKGKQLRKHLNKDYAAGPDCKDPVGHRLYKVMKQECPCMRGTLRPNIFLDKVSWDKMIRGNNNE